MDPILIGKQALNVLTSVTFLALVAMGLYIIFNLMRVVNMAHGDFLMLGAYAQLTLTALGVNFWLAVVLSAVCTAAIGMVAERILLRSLYREGELPTLLATWGLSIVIQQTVRLFYGAQTQYISLPLRGVFRIGSFSYPTYRLLITVLAWVIIAAAIWILLRTRFGVAIRATMDHDVMAGAVGIPVARIFLLAFGLGAGLAGLAGALLSPIVGILPTMGLDYIARSFFVVIVGGTGSIFGTLGGAATVGGSQGILTIFTHPTLAQIVVLLLVIGTMYLRPEGLFTRGGRREGI